ncbi:MAG TPA: right-handed parallel beta-helix repeat-containing protein [Roseiflexaceae bacterium]|nr:right-handed parallel beta-helix repeat-containing protein [Roseiflexaceae bacterium]
MKIQLFIGPSMLALALLSACGTPTNAPLPAAPAPQVRPTPPPQPAPPALAALADRVSACDALTSGEPAAAAEPQPDTPDLANSAVVHYDDESNTILLRKGARTSLAGISQIIGRPDVLEQLAPGEWLLSANLRVEPGALLRVAAPEARWLKLRSDERGFVWIKALGGEIEFTGACVSSWDAARQQYDDNYQDGRGFVLARDGARMDIRGSDLRYLGYDGPEAYGLAWRLNGTRGQLVDSDVSYNFYGVYSYEVDDLLLRGNRVHHNVMYGLDPHTRSMRLVIENNVAHDNGKHGIILAEECSNAVVRNNVAYDNLHHGIVIYQRSNDNLVEGNTAYGNGGQGININDSANTIVRGNIVYDNLDAGIGIGQRASATQLLGNLVQANRGDGIALYSDAADSLLRENNISDNSRYGIYVKTGGKLQVEANEVAGNQVGIYLNHVQAPEIAQGNNRFHANRQADLRRADQSAPADVEGG